MKIIKRRRKRTKTYKYLKIYFEYKNDKYFVEWREDFFTKKKTETWKIKTYIKRYYNEVSKKKKYVYENYEIYKISNTLKELFYQTYEKYIFDIREKKLKRIIK